MKAAIAKSKLCEIEAETVYVTYTRILDGCTDVLGGCLDLPLCSLVRLHGDADGCIGGLLDFPLYSLVRIDVRVAQHRLPEREKSCSTLASCGRLTVLTPPRVRFVSTCPPKPTASVCPC
eukprot:6629330-Prymnesium_polylepis.1